MKDNRKPRVGQTQQVVMIDDASNWKRPDKSLKPYTPPKLDSKKPRRKKRF